MRRRRATDGGDRGTLGEDARVLARRRRRCGGGRFARSRDDGDDARRSEPWGGAREREGSPVAGALDALPLPGAVRKINKQLFASLSPPLTVTDEKTVASLQKLIAFFSGDLDLEVAAAGKSAPRPAGAGGGGLATITAPDAETLRKVRAVLPALQENRVQMQGFAVEILARLTELQASRALGFVRDRAAPQATA